MLQHSRASYVALIVNHNSPGSCKSLLSRFIKNLCLVVSGYVLMSHQQDRHMLQHFVDITALVVLWSSLVPVTWFIFSSGYHLPNMTNTESTVLFRRTSLFRTFCLRIINLLMQWLKTEEYLFSFLWYCSNQLSNPTGALQPSQDLLIIHPSLTRCSQVRSGFCTTSHWLLPSVLPG